MMTHPVLVDGAVGFVGHATAHRLLDRRKRVIGIDIVNDYYDPALKEARLATFEGRPDMRFERMEIADAPAVAALVTLAKISRVVHLAAEAGVRCGIDNPFAYERSNLAGHLSVIEACRHVDTLDHLAYTSSGSVYGDKPLDGLGFSENEPSVMPVSLYAAIRRACELMSQSYATLYGMPQTGLRFFTVYGPWGRPDMRILLHPDSPSPRKSSPGGQLRCSARGGRRATPPLSTTSSMACWGRWITRPAQADTAF